jgi:excinuclease ABC subunit B
MSLVAIAEGDYVTVPLEAEDETAEAMSAEQRAQLVAELEHKMREAAKAFEFEKAAQFRDRVKALKALDLEGVNHAAGEATAEPAGSTLSQSTREAE